MSAHRYGRLAPGPQKLPDLTSYASEGLPTPPPEVQAPVLLYPQCLNNSLDDCVVAAVVHSDQVWCHLEEFGWTYPGDPVVSSVFYQLTGGVNTGLVESTVLKVWQTEGLFGRKLAAYAPVAPRHTVTVRQTVELFGLAYTGVLIPSAAEEQFNSKQPWVLTGTPADHDILGGHAVPIVGYDAFGPVFVTWGQLQQASWEWWATYAEECWALIGHEMVAAGKLHGIDLATLQHDLTLV